MLVNEFRYALHNKQAIETAKDVHYIESYKIYGDIVCHIGILEIAPVEDFKAFLPQDHQLDLGICKNHPLYHNETHVNYHTSYLSSVR